MPNAKNERPVTARIADFLLQRLIAVSPVTLPVVTEAVIYLLPDFTQLSGNTSQPRLVVHSWLLLKKLKFHEKILEFFVDQLQLVFKSGRCFVLPVLSVDIDLFVHLCQQVFVIFELPQHFL